LALFDLIIILFAGLTAFFFTAGATGAFAAGAMKGVAGGGLPAHPVVATADRINMVTAAEEIAFIELPFVAA